MLARPLRSCPHAHARWPGRGVPAAVVSLLAVTVVALGATAAVAAANPLLSGYGGPGQGSQAILGSVLLGGPSGTGGSGGGGGSTAGAQTAEGSASGSAADATGSGPSHSTRTGRAPRRAGDRSTGRSGGVSEQQGSGLELAAARTSAAGTPTLELPSADLLYGLLALVALALTAALTARMSRHTG